MNQQEKMKLEKLKKKLPSQSLIIQLLDKEQNHLAFLGCGHKQKFLSCNMEDDRDLSHFYEIISNLENEALSEYINLENDFKDKTSWATAIFITDENSKIVYQTDPYAFS